MPAYTARNLDHCPGASGERPVDWQKVNQATDTVTPAARGKEELRGECLGYTSEEPAQERLGGRLGSGTLGSWARSVVDVSEGVPRQR